MASNPSDAFSRAQLQILLQAVKSPKDIGTHKSLAQLGDSVTNLIYSLAKSVIISRFTQRKVNRTILSNALKNAGMKKFAKTRSDAHALADTTEAFIGYMFCSEGWSIDKMSSQLWEKLSLYDLNDYKEETKGAIEAFTYLLTKIHAHLQIKWAQRS
ncbi:MAG: ribonuclease III family protein [Promethearchaeota archaeon]